MEETEMLQMSFIEKFFGQLEEKHPDVRPYTLKSAMQFITGGYHLLATWLDEQVDVSFAFDDELKRPTIRTCLKKLALPIVDRYDQARIIWLDALASSRFLNI